MINSPYKRSMPQYQFSKFINLGYWSYTISKDVSDVKGKWILILNQTSYDWVGKKYTDSPNSNQGAKILDYKTINCYNGPIAGKNN